MRSTPRRPRARPPRMHSVSAHCVTPGFPQDAVWQTSGREHGEFTSVGYGLSSRLRGVK